MRRVIPSEVVHFIDAVLPGAALQAEDNTSNLEYDYTYTGQLAAVADLAERIPEHLITLPDEDYYVYIAALNYVREIIPEWQSRGNTRPLRKIPNVANGLNPVTLVRKFLATCPDDLPSPQSQQFVFIADKDLKASLHEDMAIIERALADHEWKTATVMAGALIEAVLLWALEEKDVKSPGVPLARAKALKLSVRADSLKEWELHPFVEVAGDLGIIIKDTKTGCGLAKNFRNLIHPGRAIRLQTTCDRGTAFAGVAALEHVMRDVERWSAAEQP
jgi:hypothetical protein